MALDFEERGKPEYLKENLSEQGREPTTNLINPHMASTPGIDPALVRGVCSLQCATLALPFADEDKGALMKCLD